MLDLPDFSQFLKQLAKELNAIAAHLPASEREPFYSKFRAKADLEAARQHCGTSEHAFEAVIDNQPAERRQDTLSEAERWLIAQNIRGRSIFVNGAPLPGFFRWHADGNAALSKPGDELITELSTPPVTPITNASSAPDCSDTAAGVTLPSDSALIVQTVEAVNRAAQSVAPDVPIDFNTVDALAILLTKRDPTITRDQLYRLLTEALPYAEQHLFFVNEKSFNNLYRWCGQQSAASAVALAYALEGHPVFPLRHVTDGKCSCGLANCSSPGRHPITPNGLHGATTKPGEIIKSWGLYPEANIGVATGSKSGLLVLELDRRKGGSETLTQLLQGHNTLPGARVIFDESVEQYWFMADKAVGSGALGPGIRRIAERSFAVVSSASPIPDFSAASLALAPDWLYAASPVIAPAPAPSPPMSAETTGPSRIPTKLTTARPPGPPKLLQPPPKPFSAFELMGKDIPPIRWAIDGLIPEGLVILAGHPKIGKSWLALNMAIAVAKGELVLGSFVAEKGEALYLALEDSERRLQGRIGKVAPGDDLASLHLEINWPRMEQGGLAHLDTWLGGHPQTRLVIVDTLARFRTPSKSGSNVYEQDYDVGAQLKKLADQHNVAFILVHHLRTAGRESDDPLSEVSGSAGITGSADTILMLRKPKRGELDATLLITGRDVEERELAMKFDGETGTWAAVGEAADFHKSDIRQDILRVLREAREPLGPKDIAARMGIEGNAVRQRLRRMLKDGEVTQPKDGQYVPA